MEIWKSIQGFEGRYAVSNLGRIKSLQRIVSIGFGKREIKEKILRCQRKTDGYYVVSLRIGRKAKRYYIHRLVAEAFIENNANKPCIDHINTDKGDNRACNLRWATHSENQNNTLTNEHLRERHISKNTERWRGIKKKIGEANSVSVCQYSLEGVLVAEYSSIISASRSVGVSDSHISQVCKGKRRQAGGYVWAYTGNEPMKFTKPTHYKSKTLNQYSLEGELIRQWESCRAACRALGIDAPSLCVHVKKEKEYKGYLWKYALNNRL